MSFPIRHTALTSALLAMMTAGLLTNACSSDDAATPSAPDAGLAGDGSNNADSAVGTATNGGFQITVSGEDLAVNGYDFGANAKAEGDPPAFVDGWEVRFEHVIVTIDEIVLNADPDKDENNPEALGPVVATVRGPFAVDATIGGTITGKSGSPDEKTVAIATINGQANGAAFDPTQRYAFGYSLVAASDAAKSINLDAAGQALYAEAKAKGWVMVYAGTATYKGAPPQAGSVFEKVPAEVHFTLGLKNPATYVNCQNTDLNQLPNGEFPRGLQADPTKVTTAQITIHTDHAFWSKLNVEGTELHFDPIAANASTFGAPDAGAGTVTIDDLANVNVTGFQTRSGDILPARSLVPDYAAPAGQLAFDSNGTTFAQAGSYASYLRYSAAFGGHLNADGECFVKLQFTP